MIIYMEYITGMTGSVGSVRNFMSVVKLRVKIHFDMIKNKVGGLQKSLKKYKL